MSCPGYFRISIRFIEACDRLKAWSGWDWVVSPVDVDRMSVIQPVPDGSRTPALFAYHNAGWTVFEDMSGYFASIAAKTWLEFARDDSFLLANHNTATG